MSENYIDERIVSMKFDNQNFERNANQSIKTIDKLKSSLNFSGASKGLEEVSDSVSKLDMSVIARGIDTVNGKFSAMEVAAKAAIANITIKVMDLGEKLVKSLSVEQLSKGWNKYEEKVTATQTIMSATAETWKESAKAIGFYGTQMEYVNSQLEKLNWFSDETSFSFTDMTSNIGKFTSSGVALDQAVTAMEGISLWAAKSGQNAQSASRAYYNLAQAIAVGSVKLIDWKSIENANMSTMEFKQTAIATAEAMGTLKKVSDGLWKTTKGEEVSVRNFNEGLKDGWFTSEVLLETLNEYGKAATFLSEVTEEYDVTVAEFLNNMDEYNKGEQTIEQTSTELGIAVEELIPLFEKLNSEEYKLALSAFRAGQEAKTFSEVISATQDAVSTGWMNTWSIIFGDYEETKKLWSNMAEEFYDIFAGGGAKRNSLLKEVFESKWDKLIRYVNKAGISTETFSETLIKSLRESGVPIDELIDKYGSLQEAIKHVEGYKEKLMETIRKLIDPLKQETEGVTTVTKKLEEYQKVVRSVIRGEFKSGQERYKRLTEAGWKYAEVQGLVNMIWERNGHNWKDVSFTMEELVDTFSKLSDEELESIGFTKAEVDSLKKLRQEAELSGISLEELFEQLVEDTDKKSGRELFFDSILNIISAIRTALDVIREAWDAAFPKDADHIYNLLDAFSRFTQLISDTLEDKAEKLTDVFRGLFDIFGIIGDFINVLLRKVFSAMGKTMGSLNIDIIGFLANWGKGITEFRQFLNDHNLFEAAIDAIGEAFMWTFNKVAEFLEGIYELPIVGRIIKSVSSTLKELFNFGKNIGNNFFTNLVDNGMSFKDAFMKAINDIKDKLVELFYQIPYIDEVIEGIQNGIDAIKKWMLAVYEIPAVKKIFDAVGVNVKKVFTFIKKIAVEFYDNVTKNNMKLSDSFAIALKQIGDAIKELFYKIPYMQDIISELNNLFDKFKDFGKNIVEGLVESFKNGTLIDTVLDAIKTLAVSMIDKFKEIMGIASPAKEWIRLAFQCIAGIIVGFAQGTVKVVHAISDFAKTIFGKASDDIADSNDKQSPFNMFKTILTNAFGGIVEFFKGIYTVVASLVTKAYNLVTSKGGLFKLYALIMGALNIVNAINAIRISNRIPALLGAITRQIILTARSLRGMIRSLTIRNYSTVITSILALVSVITVIALYFSNLPEDKLVTVNSILDKLTSIVLSMILGFAILIGVINLSSQYKVTKIRQQTSSIIQLAGLITSFGLVMVLFAKSLSMISDFLNIKDASKKILSLIIVVSSIIGIFALAKTLGKMKFNEHSVGLIGIASAILAMAVSLYAIFDVLNKYFVEKEWNVSNIIKTIGGIMAIITVIGAFAGAVFIMGKSMTSLKTLSGFGIGFMILSLGVVLGIVFSSISSLMRTITEIYTTLSMGGNDTKEAINGLVGILTIILGGLTLLLGTILLGITFLTALLRGQEHSILSSMLGIAAFLTTLSLFVIAMSATLMIIESVLDKAKKPILVAVTALSGLFILLGGLIAIVALIRKSDVWGGIGILTGMSLLLVAIAGAVWIINQIQSIEKAIVSLVSLTSVTVGMIALIQLLNKITTFDVKSALSSLIAYGAVASLIISIAGSLLALKDYDMQQLINVVGSMISLVSVISGFLIVFAKLGTESKWASIDLGVIATTILMVSAALSVLISTFGKLNDYVGNFNGLEFSKSLWNAVGAIIALVGSMVGLIAIAGNMKTTFTAGIGYIIAVIGAITLLAVAIALLIKTVENGNTPLALLAKDFHNFFEEIINTVDAIERLLQKLQELYKYWHETWSGVGLNSINKKINEWATGTGESKENEENKNKSGSPIMRYYGFLIKTLMGVAGAATSGASGQANIYTGLGTTAVGGRIGGVGGRIGNAWGHSSPSSAVREDTNQIAKEILDQMKEDNKSDLKPSDPVVDAMTGREIISTIRSLQGLPDELSVGLIQGVNEAKAGMAEARNSVKAQTVNINAKKSTTETKNATTKSKYSYSYGKYKNTQSTSNNELIGGFQDVLGNYSASTLDMSALSDQLKEAMKGQMDSLGDTKFLGFDFSSLTKDLDLSGFVDMIDLDVLEMPEINYGDLSQIYDGDITSALFTGQTTINSVENMTTEQLKDYIDNFDLKSLLPIKDPSQLVQKEKESDSFNFEKSRKKYMEEWNKLFEASGYETFTYSKKMTEEDIAKFKEVRAKYIQDYYDYLQNIYGKIDPDFIKFETVQDKEQYTAILEAYKEYFAAKEQQRQDWIDQTVHDYLYLNPDKRGENDELADALEYYINSKMKDYRGVGEDAVKNVVGKFIEDFYDKYEKALVQEKEERDRLLKEYGNDPDFLQQYRQYLIDKQVKPYYGETTTKEQQQQTSSGMPSANNTQLSYTQDQASQLFGDVANGSNVVNVQFPEKIETTSPDVVAAIQSNIKTLGDQVVSLGVAISKMYVRLDGNVLVGELTPKISGVMHGKVISTGRGN